MPKAPKIAIENRHGTSGSQTKLLVAGTILTMPQSPNRAARKLTTCGPA